MFILWILLKLSILAVFCLWAYGRYQRLLVWEIEPEVRFRRAYGTKPSKTAVLVLTGAFNGPPHTERIVKEFWQTVGDVYVIDYPLRRFSMFRTMLAAYNCVADKKQYDRVIVRGDSLGGLISLHLARYVQRYNSALAKKLVLVIADTPLGVSHLRIPGGGAVPAKAQRFAPLVVLLLRFCSHAGPLFNRLSSLIAKATFIPAPVEMREPGMDEAQFERHMAFLLRNQLSFVCEQIVAIARQRAFKRSDFNKHMQVIYLQCGDGSQPDLHHVRKGEVLVDGHGRERFDKKGNPRVAKRDTLVNNLDAPDKVILGDAAVRSLRELFPGMVHICVGAGTMHAASVEGWRSWEMASKKAVRLMA